MGKETKRCTAVVSCALLLGIFFVTRSYGTPQTSRESPTISYHLTFHAPERNQISIRGKISSPNSSKVELIQMSSTLEIQDFQAYDDTHQKLNPRIEKYRITIPTPKRKPVSFSYWFKTGPQGRHGHQGYLGEHFGLFNGSQLFLILYHNTPKIEVTFTLPEGWDVISSWKNQKGIFDPWKSEALWPDSFASAILAFGSFETRQEKIGTTLLSTSLSTRWSSSERDQLFKNVSKLCHYMNGLFGDSAGDMYDVVLTPLAEDGGKINASQWDFGVGTSVTPSLQRDWELIAHRIFHKFNHDAHLGMTPEYRRDEWFLEGAPAFYEHTALFESGMILEPSWQWEDPKAYHSMAQCAGRYLWNYFIGLTPSKKRLSLSKDFRIQDEVLMEFLHYTQAKLGAALLDEEIRRVTQGEKSLKDLLTYQYHHYQQQKGSFDLLRDLKKVTSHDFTPFFKETIYPRTLLPLWRLGEKYPWGEGGGEEAPISLPVTPEEAEGLRQLKGIPQSTLQAIQNSLLQHKSSRVKIESDAKTSHLSDNP